MPKDPWTYKRRKRRSKGKVQANPIECSRLPDPGEPSTSIGLISEMPLSNIVKTEEESEKNVGYPEVRFPHSTTLFPAGGLSSLRETVKRIADDKLFSTTPKKVKVTDSTKTTKETYSDDCMIIENSPPKVRVIDSTRAVEGTFSDDCIIIEKSPIKVKVEVVDLTDDSNPNHQVLGSHVSTSFLENRKPNTTLKANGDMRVKVESDEKTCEINTDAEKKSTIQEKSEENKTSKHADTTTHNICLKSEQGIGNGDNGGVNGQVRVTNTVSVCVVKNATDARISDNHLFNDVPIKEEQNENCVVSDNCTSISNFTSDVNQTSINSVDRPVNSEQNKSKQNCEVSDCNMTAPTPPFIFRAEIPSDIPFETENLSNAINKQQTKEKVNEWLESCLVKNEKAQESAVYDKDKKGSDSSQSVLLTASKLKKEPEEMNCQEIDFNRKNTQYYEDISQKNTNTDVISETVISNELNLKNIPINRSEISSGDSQLYEPGTVCTPFLKYLNLNTKVDLLEISSVLYYLSRMIKEKENAVGDSETSNNLPTEKTKNNIKVLPSKDILRQILHKANPFQKPDGNIFYPC